MNNEGLEEYYEMMWLDFGIRRENAPSPNQLVAMKEFRFTPKEQTEGMVMTGREFWKRYGFSFSGEFNLVNGSVSNKAFLAYVDRELDDEISNRRQGDLNKKLTELILRLANAGRHQVRVLRREEELVNIEEQLRCSTKKIECLMEITQ